jgi:hypothetical protein
MTEETIHELQELDPDSFHLVPAGATGYPVLLAKAVGDAIDQEIRSQESRSNPTTRTKDRKMAKNKTHVTPPDTTPLASAVQHRARQTFGTPANVESTMDRDPFRHLLQESEDLATKGYAGAAVAKRDEYIRARVLLAERARQSEGGQAMIKTRFGGFGVPVVSNRHALPDDPDVGGI